MITGTGHHAQLGIWAVTVCLAAAETETTCDCSDPGTDHVDHLKRYEIAMIILGAVLAVVVIGFSCFLLVYVTRAFAERQVLQEEHKKHLDDRVQAALQTTRRIQFPMVLIPADKFCDLGRLEPHEALRDLGELKILDSLEEALSFLEDMLSVFFSHQWLAWGNPDPDCLQYERMVAALHEITETRGCYLDHIYVWVDYISIPQKHPQLQMLAINSLPVYAPVCDVFIVVCPQAKHADTGLMCDMHSYMRRGWCRIEQTAHSCGKGTADMYVMTDYLRPMDPGFLDQSLFVFEGDLSCCQMDHRDGRPCDKESMVLPLTGLYSMIHNNKNTGNFMLVWTKIAENMDRCFPRTHKTFTNARPRGTRRPSVFTAASAFTDDGPRAETRELFGELIDHMEVYLKTKQLRSGNNGSPATSDDLVMQLASFAQARTQKKSPAASLWQTPRPTGGSGETLRAAVRTAVAEAMNDAAQGDTSTTASVVLDVKPMDIGRCLPPASAATRAADDANGEVWVELPDPTNSSQPFFPPRSVESLASRCTSKVGVL